MNKKVWLGILLGIGIGYALSLQRLVSMQEKLTELSKPPRKISPNDSWEYHKPDTANEYKFMQARVDWLRNILVKYVYPYIDRGVSTLLIEEILTPLNEKLVEMEMQQEARERASELLRRQKMAAGQTDD